MVRVYCLGVWRQTISLETPGLSGFGGRGSCENQGGAFPRIHVEFHFCSRSWNALSQCIMSTQRNRAHAGRPCAFILCLPTLKGEEAGGKGRKCFWPFLFVFSRYYYRYCWRRHSVNYWLAYTAFPFLGSCKPISCVARQGLAPLCHHCRL